MANFVISVVDVSAPQKIATAKGGYQAVEIAYKKDGRIEGKKIMDFVSKEMFSKVQTLEVGKDYEITAEKDARDYWQWVGVTPFSGESPKTEAATGNTSSGGVSRSPAASGRVTGSNYETPEERARRQILIVRQSSLSNALTLLTHNSDKGPVDVVDVLSLSQRLVDWVFNENQAKSDSGKSAKIPLISKGGEVATGVQALQEMEDDVLV